MTHRGSRKILEVISEAGWDPFNPGEECSRATAPRPMPERLSELDAIGVYCSIVQLVLLSRFARGKRNDERRRQLMSVAVLFVLARMPVEPTPERAAELAVVLERWRGEVLVPSIARLKRAEPSDDFDPEVHEPALTKMILEEAMGRVDADRDREDMRTGRAAHEEDRPKPEHLDAMNWDEMRGIPSLPSWDEMLAYYKFASAQRPISYFDDSGQLRLSPRLLKGALDTVLEPLERRSRRERQREISLEEALEVPDKGVVEALEALSAVEVGETYQRIVAARLARTKPGTARQCVLEHFDSLASREMSCSDLAETVSFSENRLRRVLVEEAMAVRAELLAA